MSFVTSLDFQSCGVGQPVMRQTQGSMMAGYLFSHQFNDSANKIGSNKCDFKSVKLNS